MLKALIGLLTATCLLATTVPALGKARSSKKIQMAALEVPVGYDWSKIAIPVFPELPLKGDPVDEYLCEVYNRMPSKIDGSGDFSWKDQAAAKKLNMSTCQYVIGGMHMAFKKGLFELGQKADDQGIPWSFLSGYRGEYRQRIATGFKAGPCGSWHGGRECKEKGYGHGRAADLWTYKEDGTPARSANQLFALIDKIGKDLGIIRPMKGGDPAHTQLLRMDSSNTRIARNVTIKKRRPIRIAAQSP